MHNLNFIWVRQCNVNCRGNPSQVLHLCLARHFSDGLYSNTGRYHFGSVCFSVCSCIGSSAATNRTGLRMARETGTSSPNWLLCLCLVLIIICLDGAVDAATTSPGTMTHHVPGANENQYIVTYILACYKYLALSFFVFCEKLNDLLVTVQKNKNLIFIHI